MTAEVASDAFVDDDAVLGSRCAIDGGAFVGPGCSIEADVRISARATVACDQQGARRTVVCEGASIGIAAVIGGPLVVGQGAVVRAGAVVLGDVPAYAVVEGNPAVVVGYTTAIRDGDIELIAAPIEPLEQLDVCGATLIRLPEHLDLRGSLSVIQEGAGLPFRPGRVFMTYDIANRQIRGSHAHRTLHEVLIVIGGSATVVVDDGNARKQVRLDHPSVALHCPPMRWLTQYDYTPNATLVVLASDVYDEADYIRSYDEFLAIARG